MKIDENILITLTSWSKRIGNVKTVLESMLSQTLLPNKILLSFCVQDFPNMEDDFPEDLKLFLESNKDIIEVYWYIENYKSWKKHLHALDIADDNTLIICIDDDHLYPNDFVEKMYMSYVYYDKRFPITYNKKFLFSNVWSFSGSGTLYRKSDWGDYKKYLTQDILHNCIDDYFIVILLAVAGVVPMPIKYEFPNDIDLVFNDINPISVYTKKNVYTQEDHDATNKLVDSSLIAMEESLKEHYFKGRTPAYNPGFWEILTNLVNNLKENEYGKYPELDFMIDIYNKNFLKSSYYDLTLGQKLNLNKQLHHMKIEENLIVTMTSWNKRINNVATVIESLLNQTIQPNKILINLCIQNFPNMEEDLPKDLLNIVSKNDNIEIYWFIEDYKAWKKHLHALDIAKDDDLIISVDDDHIYPTDFIEKMYVSYCYYGKKYPVTLNKIMLCHNCWTFNGPGTLYRKSDWGNYKKYLTYNVLHNCINDIFVTILFALNNVMILPEMFNIPKDSEMLFNDNNAYTDKAAASRHNEENPMKDLRDSTLIAMEESLDKNYFKDKNVAFRPHFWEVLNDMMTYYRDNKKEELEKYPCMKFAVDNFFKNYLQPNIYDINYRELFLDLPRSSFRDAYIGKDNKLIITLSSWPKRISNVVPVLKSILNNTILPTDIIVNLAAPDWGFNVEDITPEKIESVDNLRPLLELIKDYPIIKINWYNDSLLKSWKKHLYVINNYSDNDVVICIDDDILYSEVFVETMIKSYNYYDREFPITSITSSFCQGMFGFCGHSTLYRPGDFKDFDKYITPEILHMLPEDNHLLNILYINNKLLMPVIGRNYLFKDENFNSENSNFGNNNFDDTWWKNYSELMAESGKIIERECSNRKELSFGWKPNCYNFSYSDATKFIERYKNLWTEGIKKQVYDSIVNHVNSGFGTNMKTYLECSLDNKII